MNKIRWGVLGVAKIATAKVIPAMQAAAHCRVLAIASRDGARASRAAADLGISHAHSSYEALLANPEVDAVYIPLPNHLHVPWATRAADAGKHVLCEKPIALNAAEARTLPGGAGSHRCPDSGSIHGAHASAVAARQGARRQR